MLRSTVVLALFFLLLGAAPPRQPKIGGGEVTIGRFAVTDIHPENDTVALADSARITLSLGLDCTNKITRFEAVADTSGGRLRMVVSVFGTFVHGRRPMCPIRIIKKSFALKFPGEGEWEIVPAAPDGKPLRTQRSAIVVRDGARGHPLH